MARTIRGSITCGLDKDQKFEISTFDNRMLCWLANGEIEVFIYIHDYDKARELRDHLTKMIEMEEVKKASADVETV